MFRFIIFLLTAAVFQTGLIELKLSGILLCSWGLILTPAWLVLLIVVYNVYKDIINYKKELSGED